MDDSFDPIGISFTRCVQSDRFKPLETHHSPAERRGISEDLGTLRTYTPKPLKTAAVSSQLGRAYGPVPRPCPFRSIPLATSTTIPTLSTTTATAAVAA